MILIEASRLILKPPTLSFTLYSDPRQTYIYFGRDEH